MAWLGILGLTGISAITWKLRDVQEEYDRHDASRRSHTNAISYCERIAARNLSQILPHIHSCLAARYKLDELLLEIKSLPQSDVPDAWASLRIQVFARLYAFSLFVASLKVAAVALAGHQWIASLAVAAMDKPAGIGGPFDGMAERCDADSDGLRTHAAVSNLVAAAAEDPATSKRMRESLAAVDLLDIVGGEHSLSRLAGVVEQSALAAAEQAVGNIRLGERISSACICSAFERGMVALLSTGDGSNEGAIGDVVMRTLVECIRSATPLTDLAGVLQREVTINLSSQHTLAALGEALTCTTAPLGLLLADVVVQSPRARSSAPGGPVELPMAAIVGRLCAPLRMQPQSLCVVDGDVSRAVLQNLLAAVVV